jgi:hypothetical protein
MNLQSSSRLFYLKVVAVWNLPDYSRRVDLDIVKSCKQAPEGLIFHDIIA